MLKVLKNSLSDYQQTMSYVSGILLLFFDEETAFQMMFVLGRSPKYALSGYWRAEAVGQAIDAYVVNECLRDISPAIQAHLARHSILPETYIAKWFGGLCVQVMPIEFLIDFWSQFFHLGYRYLFKFAISLLQMLGERLLRSSVDFEIYEILRLEPRSKYFDNEHVIRVLNEDNIRTEYQALIHLPISARVTYDNLSAVEIRLKRRIFFTELLAKANSIGGDNNFDSIDISRRRERAFERHLKQRLTASATAIHFVAETVAESADDDNQDCGFCTEGFADFFCSDCQQFLCDDCHENEMDDHTAAHTVQEVEVDVD
jgi:hypothetical protein